MEVEEQAVVSGANIYWICKKNTK